MSYSNITIVKGAAIRYPVWSTPEITVIYALYWSNSLLTHTATSDTNLEYLTQQIIPKCF